MHWYAHDKMMKSIRSRMPVLALAGLACLLVFQAVAYFRYLPLWLSPRVILHPWLLTRGFIPYEEIVDQHMPLMPLFLSTLLRVFPDAFETAKAALVVLLSVSTGLTFYFAKRTAGWLGGVWAAGFFIAWSPGFGFGKLWYESFLTPVIMLWMFFYRVDARPLPARSSLLLGFLGGIAVLIKQQAAILFLAFLAWDVMTRRLRRRPVSEIAGGLGYILAGMMLPVLAYAVFQYALAGSLRDFWYWTFTYNLVSPYKTWAFLQPTVAQAGILASCFLLVPAAVILSVDLRRKNDSAWLDAGLWILLLVSCAVFAYPRFEFFHLQPMLPMVAVVSAWTLAKAQRRADESRGFVIGVAVALSAMWFATQGRDYRPVVKPEQERPVYDYSTLVPLADGIRGIIGPFDRVYVMPDFETSANLYCLLDRPPPRFWILHYPWYLVNGMDLRIASSLNDSLPEWVVRFPDRWGGIPLMPEVDGLVKSRYRRAAGFPWTYGEVVLLRRAMPGERSSADIGPPVESDHAPVPAGGEPHGARQPDRER